jgi:hypothetical protein
MVAINRLIGGWADGLMDARIDRVRQVQYYTAWLVGYTAISILMTPCGS